MKLWVTVPVTVSVVEVARPSLPVITVAADVVIALGPLSAPQVAWFCGGRECTQVADTASQVTFPTAIVFPAADTRFGPSAFTLNVIVSRFGFTTRMVAVTGAAPGIVGDVFGFADGNARAAVTVSVIEPSAAAGAAAARTAIVRNTFLRSVRGQRERHGR